MKPWLTDLLCCPNCPPSDGSAHMAFAVEPDVVEDDDVIEGSLVCRRCAKRYPITRGIPRFVAVDEDYAGNFGEQWNLFRTTQIDRLAGHHLSETRFVNDTRWSADWLQGKLILDAGCGAGRFTDVMAEMGARVVSCDLSGAVEACRNTVRDTTGQREGRGDVDVIQANLLNLPLRSDTFDGIFCMGVIQHTPDPAAIMRALPRHLKPGGPLAYNFYEIDPFSKFQVIKYLLRRWTPDWSPKRLHGFCRWLCRVFFPLSYLLAPIPKIRFINRFLPVCATHPQGIPMTQQYEMTLLDTIDWYGPKFEIRQDHENVRNLLKNEGLEGVSTAPGLAWAQKAAKSPHRDVNNTKTPAIT